MSDGLVEGHEPRRPRRRGAVLILALVGGLAAIILVAVVIVVINGTGDDPKTVTGNAAHEAGRNLRRVAGLSLSGTYAGGRAAFTVTRAGTARGTYAFGGERVDRVDVDSTTYLKTGQKLWRASGQSSSIAQAADGVWTRAPNQKLGLDDLSPDQLGLNLQRMAYRQVGRKTSLNGVKAMELTTAGLTYFLSAKEPRRVLRVQGGVIDGAFSFDLTPLSSSAMSTFFTRMRSDVRALKDAYNPDIVFLPTSKQPHYGDCGPSGCTFSGTIVPDAAGGGKVHVVTTIRFKGAGKGVVSKCSSSSLTTQDLPVKYSCRTSGSAWASWYTAHTGRFMIYAMPIFRATVNSAKDVSGLLTLLAREQRAGR